MQVMETVNVEMDLRNFIRQARREVASDVAVAAQAAAAAANEAAAAAAPPDIAAAAAAGPAVDEAGAAVANEAAAGVALANGGNGPVAVAVAAGGTATGAGVLSTRADRRGAALAFERLFGVGQVRPLLWSSINAVCVRWRFFSPGLAFWFPGARKGRVWFLPPE